MNCFITLDYELCMGKISGTPEKCLIEPMDHLRLMLNKYGIKINIFVDAAYLLQLNKLRKYHSILQRDYEAITRNIRSLDNDGHAIQLHLHPQWCFSSFDGEKWILDTDHYKLSDMPLSQQKKLIIDGTSLLNSLISSKITSFRAGGYSVENFFELYDTFLSLGITNDTSVLRGEKATGKYQSYDYRRVPRKTVWKFCKNHKEECIYGKMSEYPISTIVVPSFLYLINRYIGRAKKVKVIDAKSEKWGDGIGIGYPGNKFQILQKKIGMFFGKKSIVASLDTGVDLDRVYNYSKKYYEGEDFVIIGHPKAFSPFSVKMLEYFILTHPEIKFKTFKNY